MADQIPRAMVADKPKSKPVPKTPKSGFASSPVVSKLTQALKSKAGQAIVKAAAAKKAAAAAKAAAAKAAAAKGTPGKPAVPGKPNIAPPRLTTAQAEKLRQYDEKYGLARSSLTRRVTDASARTNLSLAQNTRTHDVSTDRANQAYAARGLFQSSIRDSDLNDLDASLAIRNNVLNTNLATLTTDTNRHIATMDTDWATTHNQYNQQAVANAQGQTPALATPGIPAVPAKPPAKPAPQNEERRHTNIVPRPPANEEITHTYTPVGVGSGLTGTLGHPPVPAAQAYGAL